MGIRSRIMAWLCGQVEVGCWEGIILCDCNSDTGNNSAFTSITRDALDLIRRTSPRQSARISRYIRYILNTKLDSWARYGPGPVCQIDFGAYPFGTNPDWSLFQYAGSIVHEATHGLLLSKGIPYDKQNKLRVEAICRQEQNRFLRQLERIHHLSLTKPFDPGEWKDCSRLQRLCRLIRRIREERRKARSR